jgi:methylphosphotriester-DNA--protein-cysteine methyltransferase
MHGVVPRISPPTEGEDMDQRASMRTALVPLHPALTDYVESIVCEAHWIDPAGSPALYGVPPTPCPVLGFQYRGRLAVLRDGGDELLAPGGVTGVQTTIAHYRTVAETGTILVIFRPYGAFTVLDTAMHALARTHVPLVDIISPPQVDQILEQLAAAREDGARAQVVQSWLLHRVARAAHTPHPGVRAAVDRLLASHGADRIDHLAAELALNRRQLERLFKQQIGVSPKEVASLARFAWTLRRVSRERPGASLAAEAGYADQAHLIRDFGARVGMPPTAYAASTRENDPR